MKLLSALVTILRKPTKALSTLEDYKQEALMKQGRLQFEKLLKKGLSIPVALL